MSAILVGEHDKGLCSPFSPETVSGRRLRKIVEQVGLQCEFANAFDFTDGQRVQKTLRLSGVVVALGRVAEAELHRQNIKCLYLPHPACRSKKQLEQLENGLRNLTMPINATEQP